MKIGNQWNQVKELFENAQKTGGYCSVATVNGDGFPHITPIGSLFLLEDCQGVYWEKFPRIMKQNMEKDQRICAMAINSSQWYWIKSLYKGKFPFSPGIRLMGTAGKRTRATDHETAMWQKRIRYFKWSKGYDLLWSDMKYVRQVRFDAFEPVRAGAMSSGLWPDPA